MFVDSAGGSTNLVRVLSELCASLVPARKSRESLSDLCTSENAVEELADDVLGLSGLLEKRLQALHRREKKKVLIVVDAVNGWKGRRSVWGGYPREWYCRHDYSRWCQFQGPEREDRVSCLKSASEITEPLVVHFSSVFR